MITSPIWIALILGTVFLIGAIIVVCAIVSIATEYMKAVKREEDKAD